MALLCGKHHPQIQTPNPIATLHPSAELNQNPFKRYNGKLTLYTVSSNEQTSCVQKKLEIETEI